ncbi:uncharacterized protein F5147DRAFT_780230 [Suillus discolor]|uniref:DUF8190 domain-containing protein n=1 Tax=Suillus discolor TaxID=1912936 RepID=A0A9P7JMV0_9AGAM|nr:uncharacterized protein F5147DRAFT_780230 [Suillus discolor]KAG2090773.1 hypothetical protein F5147DRAFT_780230 [Suillus discolor]
MANTSHRLNDSSSDDDFDIDEGFLSSPDDEASPFNLDEVPSGVESEDPLQQREVFDGIFLAREGQDNTGPTWEQTPICNMPLSAFERLFRRKDKSSAATSLLRRTNLCIDPKFTYASDDSRLLWDASRHFLDFVLVVSGTLGLDAFLPNTISDHTFTVTLDFRLQTKQFRPKFGKLGFDPTGSMMAIGNGSACELWLGFCPLANVEDLSVADEAPLLNKKKHGDTRLSSRHFRMAVMFMAYALAKIPTMPIHLMHTYGTDEDFSSWKIKDVTNLYATPTLTLRLDDLKSLHQIMVSAWDAWVEEAPPSWKVDGWLESHVPLSVACRYGQNQPIASSDPNARSVEERNWQVEREYTNIRYLSMAIATDLTCKPVRSWQEVPNEEILEAHNIIYDSPDPIFRQPANLDDFPARDPRTQKENNIYDEEGHRIPRFHGICSNNTKPCGVLINLETITELFSTFIPDDDSMALDPDIIFDDDIRTPIVNVYPQAFLRKYGHIQCNSILPHFAPFMSKIRNAVSRSSPDQNQDLFDGQPADGDADEFDRLPSGSLPTVLFASGSQFYNEISHRIRPSADLHDVQQGRITSALSGAYSHGHGQTTHRIVMRECRLNLPHQRYDNKIKVNDIPRALRLENIYIFQLDSLKRHKRNGASIYRDMVVPLASSWSHPTIFQALRPHLLVLTSEAFPQVYQWTTYPITSLLERIWDHFSPLVERGVKPAPQAIELCSVLERALAYAHTGNTKVIATSLMRPLWLVQSLLEHGLPTFSPSVRFAAPPSIPIAISPADWPTLTSMKVPAIASKRSQILTYGNDHFEVCGFLSTASEPPFIQLVSQAYKAEFHITLSVNQLSSNAFLGYPSNLRHAIIIALVALQVYIADVKTLVTKAVTVACSDMEAEDGGDGELHAAGRRKGLRKWLATTHPLGYADKGYEYLVSCVHPKSTDHHEGLPNPTNVKLSVHDFAQLICNMSRKTDPVPVAAPLISGGCSTPVFRVALVHMRKYAPKDSPTHADKFLHDAFIVAANHLHINNVPWHRPAGPRGRRSRKPVFDSWVNLGKAVDLQAIKRNHTQSGNAAAEASQRAQAADSRAAWSADSITLQSLPDYILRSRLPDEFSLESIDLADNSSSDGQEPSSREIYEWVFANFNINKPLHQIALIAGIYVSRIIPDIFWANSDKPKAHTVADHIALTNAIRALPWKPNASGRKGCKLPQQFIAMVPAYILAVYDEKSPLRIHCDKRKSFPKPWNAKNSAKGIGPLLLVRLGLLRAVAGRVWKGGPPFEDWKLLSAEAVAAKHREIAACLADRQYGPFRLGVMFLGIDKAVSLGRTSQTYTINPAISSIKANKRASKGDSDSDDVEIVEVRMAKRPRST